jgi:hypothetical protein
MKEIIIHLIDRIFNDVEGCLVLIACFGLFIVIPIAAALSMMVIK